MTKGLSCLFGLIVTGVACGGVTTVREEKREFLTYPFSDPDPVPAVATKRYPYFRYDGSAEKAEKRTWTTVVLENGKIRVTLMPEIGGKVWGAVDLKTGVDFVYYNHVVKFRDIAMRGPWVSGGIEYNFGILGHAPSSATPVDWCVRTNADGSASFFAASDEYVTRSRWQVEVRLRPEAEQFETHTTWSNVSGLEQPYYHWMNAAFHLEKDARFLFPATRYSGHTGRTHDWPVDAQGRDLSVYAANAFGFNKSYHVLNGDGRRYAVWWPERGIGAVHSSRDWEKFGRKIWLWSLAREGGIWEDLLTDSDGQYTELQSGRYFIQPIRGNHLTPFKHPCFTPGSTETFSETWGVLRTPEMFERGIAAKTPQPRPEKMPDGFDWNTAAGYALRGWQYLLDHDIASAEKEFAGALAIDPDTVNALNGMASLELRRARYKECHEYCRRVLSIDTTEESANYHDGLAYFAEGDYASARNRLGVAAFGLRYRSAAYALIARSYLAEGNPEEARFAADKSLQFNSANPDAQLSRLISIRLSGDSGWTAYGRSLLNRQPLFHAVRHELEGLSFMSYVRNEFPSETVRDLAFWYRESGLAAEADRLGKLAEGMGGPRLPPFRREEAAGLRRMAAVGGWRAKYEYAAFLAGFNLAEEADALLADCGNEPDVAAFYLFRGGRRKGAAALADFKRAETCPDADWRVGRALAGWYAAEKNFDEVISVARRYLERYRRNNPLQLAYADALVKRGLHEEAMAFLRTVTILPSENADGAWRIWNAAEKALGLGPTYPENLGYGEPFKDSSEDLRDQCLDKPAPDVHSGLPVKGKFDLGYMLDVSRDKVPTMATLYRIVDILSELGYNQFQLYTEHSFAYAGHETVWKDASPLTPQEVRELDDYCWRKGVALVPNQNSFGHLERWLKHPEYRHLAEAPDCPVNPWGGKAPWPKALCPTDPASTNFLADLYGQLLPCFRHTDLFNVGCDEVFDLMPGVRSADAIATRGEGAVFLDHFRGLQTLSAAHGKHVMYWADHLLRSERVAARLPKDAVAIIYKYEADDPFEHQAARAKRLGIPFYVGPGTSSWCSLFGRYWNMKLNVAAAFDAAREYGARGCLLCDWGDLGHVQPFLVSLPALVYASECAKGHRPSDEDVVRIVDRVTGTACGKALLMLGDLYRLAYDSQLNTTALFRLLQEGRNYKRPWYWDDARMNEAFAYGHSALEAFKSEAAPEWVRDDFRLIELLLQTLELSWKRQYDRVGTEIVKPYRELWLKKNRPGGLDDSVKTLFGSY